MSIRGVLTAWTILLTACSGIPVIIETPVTLVGVVSKPTFTGWYVNFCANGQLTDSLPVCAQIGGEIYKATLLDSETLDGKGMVRKLVIGFPAHALPPDYRARKRIQLERAPDDFKAATGIAYFARNWSDS
jgi:hypothetical protein